MVLEGQRYPLKAKLGKNLAEVISQSGIEEIVDACECFSNLFENPPQFACPNTTKRMPTP